MQEEPLNIIKSYASSRTAGAFKGEAIHLRTDGSPRFALLNTASRPPKGIQQGSPLF
jgi:hypothetical protein